MNCILCNLDFVDLLLINITTLLIVHLLMNLDNNGLHFIVGNFEVLRFKEFQKICSLINNIRNCIEISTIICILL